MRSAARSLVDFGLPELMRPEQVAEWLELRSDDGTISVRALYLMVQRGEIPGDCILRFGRRLRFDAVRLRSWAAEKRGPSRESAR
jgi:hypothetical protein